MDTKRKRVNMRIPAYLIDFIKEHTKKSGTNMTNDYIDYLKRKVSEATNVIK